MSFSDDERDFWNAYNTIKARMGDTSTRKDEGLEFSNRRASPTPFRIPQAVFSKYPFRRVTRAQVKVIV